MPESLPTWAWKHEVRINGFVAEILYYRTRREADADKVDVKPVPYLDVPGPIREGWERLRGDA